MGIDKATHVRERQCAKTDMSECVRRKWCAQVWLCEKTLSEKCHQTPRVWYVGVISLWATHSQHFSSVIRLFLPLLHLSNPQPKDKREHSRAPQEQQRPFCQAAEWLTGADDKGREEGRWRIGLGDGVLIGKSSYWILFLICLSRLLKVLSSLLHGSLGLGWTVSIRACRVLANK